MALISNLKTPDDQTFDIRAGAIPFGEVDSTSTATVFTATVPGITELTSGTMVMLRNATVTSASGFTLNINGLGAKPVYSNMGTGNPITPTNPTRETTIFNINYTLIFIYSETLVAGGAWINYRGYYSDANSVGYQIRTNSSTRPTTDKFYRYRILFESADGKKWIPSNTSTSTNATAARAVNQRPINPWGDIVYYGTTSAIEANANVTPAQLWQQYALTFGYSFNRTGAALVLPYPSPIYIKCAPQSDGSAIIDADTPYVTSLPNTEDGNIYIYLGRSYSATAVELVFHHPVYYYKDGAIREWTNAAASGGGAVDSVNGQTGAVVLDAEDVGALPDTTTIPTKTSDLTNDSGFITSAQAPVQSVNGQTGAVSITIPTVPSASTTTPSMDGTASYGSGTTWARADHVHPTDTSRQATLVSGTNIKTINGNSLLGSGDLTVGGGGGNNLVLYANSGLSALYFDAQLTEQLNADHYDYDHRAAYEDLQSYDTIKIIENPDSSTYRTMVVSCIGFDPIEDEVEINVWRKTTIGRYYF